ncbi:MAG TPA: small basic protein [Phycisphaerae bacterium]|nr:small basic protein [Phycisphaerae bacterium]HPS53633.1 small basic protein [Phycisphaerae bacterium]
MSIDSSLKKRGSLRGKRSVLTRAERIEKMKAAGKFNPTETSPLGMPKCRVEKD